MTIDPAGAGPIGDLADIPDAILRLQRSSRRTVPVAILGFALTIAAGVVGIYYIFNLSSRLNEARDDLAQTQSQLISAQADLGAARAALTRVRAALPTDDPATTRAVETAIDDVARSERNLEIAAVSLQQASDNLPTGATTAPERWFAVVASYDLDEAGLALARRQIASQGRRNCLEIWQTRHSDNYAVVLGGVVDRPAAHRNVALARRTGIASDAYVLIDRDWTFIARSARCAEAAAAQQAAS